MEAIAHHGHQGQHDGDRGDVDDDVDEGCGHGGSGSGSTCTPGAGAMSTFDAPILSTTGKNATDPAIAFDGTNYLVVWADSRTSDQLTDIWGTRVDQNGTILDPAGIQIAATPGVQGHPTVAFDGTRYLVAYEDFKLPGGSEADIAVAAVSTSGAVSSLGAVATTASSETSPVLITTASRGLLTWRAGGQIFGATYDGSFGAPFAITSGSNPKKDVAVAANPAGDYLVAFTETSPVTDDDIRAQLVTPGGALDGPAFDVSSGSTKTENASAVFADGNYLVVWSSYYTGVDIYGTTISPAGVVLDHHTETTGTVGGKLIDAAPQYQEAPAIACAGSSCLVTWQDKRNIAADGYDLYGRLVATDLSTLGGDFAVSAEPLNQTVVRTVATASGYFAVWQDARAGVNASLKVGGTRVTASGSVLDAAGLQLVPGYNFEQAPMIARNGTTLAVAWNDSRSTWGDDVEMVRTTTSGAILDADPFAVSAADYAQVATAGAPLDTAFLVAWSDNRNGHNADVFAARVAAGTGAVLDPAGIELSFGNGNNVSPAVASSGAQALVVWSDATSNTDRDLYGALVDASGTASAPIVICSSTGEQNRPAVSYDAGSGDYVVVWSDTRSGQADIYAARVATSGAVLDPGGVLVAGAASGQRVNPKLAVIGTTALVVYADSRSGNWDIYGTRLGLGSSLAVLDPTGLQLTTDPATQAAPAVTAVGSQFLVAWVDSRASATSNDDIWVQPVPTSGPPAGAAFIAAGDASEEASPSLVDVSASRAVLAYSVQTTSPQTSRIAMRTVDVCDTAPALTSIEVTPASPTIQPGASLAFAATGHYSDGTTQDVTSQVTWASSHATIASITSGGVATGLHPGTTVVSATLGGVSGSTTLTVACASDDDDDCGCDDGDHHHHHHHHHHHGDD